MAALASTHSRQVVHGDLRTEVIRRSSRGGRWRFIDWSEASTDADEKMCAAEMRSFKRWLQNLILEEEGAQTLPHQPEEPDTEFVSSPQYARNPSCKASSVHAGCSGGVLAR